MARSLPQQRFLVRPARSNQGMLCAVCSMLDGVVPPHACASAHTVQHTFSRMVVSTRSTVFGAASLAALATVATVNRLELAPSYHSAVVDTCNHHVLCSVGVVQSAGSNTATAEYLLLVCRLLCNALH